MEDGPNVRPGLTGLFQATVNIDMTWEQKFVLDVKYTRNTIFIGDVEMNFMMGLQVFFCGRPQYGDFFRKGLSGSDKVAR